LFSTQTPEKSATRSLRRLAIAAICSAARLRVDEARAERIDLQSAGAGVADVRKAHHLPQIVHAFALARCREPTMLAASENSLPAQRSMLWSHTRCLKRRMRCSCSSADVVNSK
jgi:hypothetical protein